MSDILLITPPFTQINTPYPATAYLKSFLQGRGQACEQLDLGIEVINAMFSKEGLRQIFKKALGKQNSMSPNALRILHLSDSYVNTVDAVISFLQGKNPTLARQINATGFLPKASRFDNYPDIQSAFGSMGMQDKAKHRATLYLEDLSDFIQECVDADFGFSRYAEGLGRSASSFDNLYQQLSGDASFTDAIALDLLNQKLLATQPRWVCFSIPFPGNLYSAFKCAQFIKKNFPQIRIVAGGGFPNTELRSLKDQRVFEFFDYIVLDDGERPLELLLKQADSGEENLVLKRTYLIKNKTVFFVDNDEVPDYSPMDLPAPDYADLPLDKYISVIEIPNPMHSLWSDGRWNKLNMAHGCYWGKCAFCDVSLSYIKHYSPQTASNLADKMEHIMAQTGQSGFHFVDEAAPPKIMIQLALEIIKRKMTVTWWANIRFERSFTSDVCALLHLSGCIAVSGGLEVASDRLLKLINKGVTVEQVAAVTHNFTRAGNMVHAYLMYGFPTQTVQETIDSLEMVRQMFRQGIVRSGFWHRFALTAHSPVGLNPDKYKIVPQKEEITFAHNDVLFVDKTGVDHDKFSFGLKKSLYNYMQGVGFEMPLQDWFDFKIPKTTIDGSFISKSITNANSFQLKLKARLIWTGSISQVKTVKKFKRGKAFENIEITIHSNTSKTLLVLEREQGLWLSNILATAHISLNKTLTMEMIKADYEKQFDNFELFWFSKPMDILRMNGLLLIG